MDTIQPENVSSSMARIGTQIATWFPSPIHFRCEIDSVDRPGHGHRVMLPDESEPESLVDGA
jgi:hypothetical protein